MKGSGNAASKDANDKRYEVREDRLMAAPVKPCDGSFSEETKALLLSNVNRAQWLLHPCVHCGQQVGARLEKGLWVPDAHWPSVPRRVSKSSS
jgi:hypothetical protein